MISEVREWQWRIKKLRKSCHQLPCDSLQATRNSV